MAITFDTHKFIKTLQDAGMSTQQAEAISNAVKESQAEFDTAVATKSDAREIMLMLKGLYIAGIFGFAVLGWLCMQVFEISQKIPK